MTAEWRQEASGWRQSAISVRAISWIAPTDLRNLRGSQDAWKKFWKKMNQEPRDLIPPSGFQIHLVYLKTHRSWGGTPLIINNLNVNIKLDGWKDVVCSEPTAVTTGPHDIWFTVPTSRIESEFFSTIKHFDLILNDSDLYDGNLIMFKQKRWKEKFGGFRSIVT